MEYGEADSLMALWHRSIAEPKSMLSQPFHGRGRDYTEPFFVDMALSSFGYVSYL